MKCVGNFFINWLLHTCTVLPRFPAAFVLKRNDASATCSSSSFFKALDDGSLEAVRAACYENKPIRINVESRRICTVLYLSYIARILFHHPQPQPCRPSAGSTGVSGRLRPQDISGLLYCTERVLKYY